MPGHVWNYDSKKFMEVIKFNKDCMNLGDVTDFINEHAFDNIFTPKNLESGDIA